MFKVIDRLYIGNRVDSENKDALKSINVIVNCTIHLPFTEVLKKCYRIPVEDDMKDESIENFYKLTLNTIGNVILDYKVGNTILVHCNHGNQRSAAFVVVFLMILNNWNLNRSINYLLSKKPNVFGFGNDINFLKALQKFSIT